MKATLLANKKLTAFLDKPSKSSLEIKIRSRLIYEGFVEHDGFIQCKAKDIWVVAHRAWYYGILIVGVESNIDDDIPFYNLCIEDFVEEIRNFGELNPTQWIISALMPVVIKHPDIQLKFYIDIPEINIPVLKKTIEGLL